MKHFLSLRHLDSDRLLDLVEVALRIGVGEAPAELRCDGRIVGLLFLGPSTRTRTAFGSAALRLGASIMQFGPADLQLATGETMEDTGRVLSQYLDGLVIRTNGSDEDLAALARQGRMSVVNAMSASEHPTQVIGDLAAIKEATGGLEDRSVVYVGEGNNSAAALAYAVALVPGMRLTLLTPPGYGLAPGILAEATARARGTGAEVVEVHDMSALPGAADVLYTSRWETMGVPHADPDWRRAFRPFKATREVFERLDTRGRTVFMHDLPAVRGQDCDGEILDGPSSIAWRQAFHKMTAAMAILGRTLKAADGNGMLTGTRRT